MARPQRPEPVKPVSFDHKKPATKPQEVKVGGDTTPHSDSDSKCDIFSFKGKTQVPVVPGGKDVAVEPEKDFAVLLK